ncbi:MAG: hypothetical protein Q9M92_15600 [Enterobacterales bacterium]|nr:hypothetical protein [Enterobacterales bacterium]
MQLLSACTSGSATLDGGGQEGDAVAVDYPIAYVKRLLPVVPDANNIDQAVVVNLREPVNFFTRRGSLHKRSSDT